MARWSWERVESLEERVREKARELGVELVDPYELDLTYMLDGKIEDVVPVDEKKDVYIIVVDFGDEKLGFVVEHREVRRW